ncbi:MAG: NADP-dependent oxidoreductase [Ignavibacteriaceae bacterium]|nr:NADP-dependent oxidoreductase [Ignavibacteriaceae bacterium]
MMIAVQINSFGGYEKLTINNNATKPTLAANQVLVEVYAASLNPVDKGIAAGYLKDMVHLPATLGGDFSGVVVQVGEGVSDFKIGGRVYGQAIVLNGGSGSLAQFVAANAGNTALQPNHISFTEAASLPLAGVSALQALEEHIKLKAGQKILIHGAAGGIGSLAVQIAKSLGGYVAATASSKDKDYVKGLGADLVIDFRSEKFEEMLKDYDAVLDLVSGETTNKSLKVLKQGGIIVSLLAPADPELAKKLNVTAIGQLTNTNTQYLIRLAELVSTGKVKTQIDKVFPLNQTLEALKHLGEGHPRGKVVIKIKN